MSRERITDIVCTGVWHLLEGTARDHDIEIGYDDPLPIRAADRRRAELMDDDGYDGPAELIVDGDQTVPVTVTLRGHFDPISGSYYWYGRVRADDAVAALVADGAREVVLRTPHAEVDDEAGRPRSLGAPAGRRVRRRAVRGRRRAERHLVERARDRAAATVAR